MLCDCGVGRERIVYVIGCDSLCIALSFIANALIFLKKYRSWSVNKELSLDAGNRIRGPMQIATGWSTRVATKEALEEAVSGIRGAMEEPPDFVVCQFTEQHAAQDVVRFLSQQWPHSALHGATTCRALLTPEGCVHEDNRVVGLWALRDPEGAFGTGGAELDNAPREAAAAATRTALDHAGRPGELPSLVWISTAPGNEEEVLAGIEDEVGDNVPILGGSTADNNVLGQWAQVTASKWMSNGVVVSVLFTSVEIGYAYHNGYVPQEVGGVATSSSGRVVHTIDGRPAATVYNEWTDGRLDAALAENIPVLEATAFWPLGRVRGWLNNIPLYVLAHPENVEADGGLRLFAAVQQGEPLVLMSGNRDSLVRRAGRVAESALESLETRPTTMAGALITFCGGSMLAIEDDVDQVARSIHAVLGPSPYLGGFTFGEQGRLVGGGNYHGNLMISVIIFSDQDAVF